MVVFIIVVVVLLILARISAPLIGMLVQEAKKNDLSKGMVIFFAVTFAAVLIAIIVMAAVA